MSVKKLILDLLPGHLELPARYHYNRLLGRLEPEMDLIGNLAGQRRRCIDIGANVGLYTYHFSRIFKHVESFEPIPECAGIIAAGRLGNVSLHRAALSDHDGTATLNIPDTGGPEATALASLSNRFDGARHLTVDLRTLDSYHFSSVDLIKIDVEGHEMEVLRGGSETIRRELPNLLIEIEQRHHPDTDIREILGYITGMGYRGSFLRHGALAELSEFDVSKHQAAADPRSPDYINNFIFQAVR
jgi:FkbM family methyltransferase